MRYVIFILLVQLMLPARMQAQMHIEGVVLDNATSQPLAGASVYINNTTIGTITRSDGSYSLPGIPPGKYELVVSYVGYEGILHEVEMKSNDLRLVFRMDAKVAQMREILVVSPQRRKQWLEIFRAQFLGKTPAAEETFILNEEDIVFTASGDEHVISAFSEVPLVIDNKALGYRIYFELQDFNCNTLTGKSSFFGYSYYEEMLEEGARSGGYGISRQQAYQGSTLHFFRSLKNNRLREEGFSMRTVLPAPDGGRSGKNRAGTDSRGGPEIFIPGKSYPASQKTILIKDTSQRGHYLSWEGALEVTYLPPSERPSGMSQTSISVNGSRMMVSYIFINTAPVYILDDGTPVDPRSVRFGGLWNMERVANMLPRDYSPNRKSLLNKKRP